MLTNVMMPEAGAHPGLALVVIAFHPLVDSSCAVVPELSSNG